MINTVMLYVFLTLFFFSQKKIQVKKLFCARNCKRNKKDENTQIKFTRERIVHTHTYKYAANTLIPKILNGRIFSFPFFVFYVFLFQLILKIFTTISILQILSFAFITLCIFFIFFFYFVVFHKYFSNLLFLIEFFALIFNLKNITGKKNINELKQKQIAIRYMLCKEVNEKIF